MSLDLSKYEPYSEGMLKKTIKILSRIKKSSPTPCKEYDFIVIDAMHLFYRNYYALHDLCTQATSILTGGIYGFLRSLISFKKKWNGKTLILWDGKPKARYAVSSSYKEGRKNPDDVKTEEGRPKENFYQQLTFLQQVLGNLNVSQLYVEDAEADDIAYWVANENILGGDSAIFVSGDNDWLGIINDKKCHHLWRPGFKEGQGRIYTEANFKELKPKTILVERPNQLFLEKVFVGDKSDRVSGIPRFSKKYLQEIINKLYTNPKTGYYYILLWGDMWRQHQEKTFEIPKNYYEIMEVNKELLESNFKLIAPLTLLDSIVLISKGVDNQDQVQSIFESLEIKSLTNIFNL